MPCQVIWCATLMYNWDCCHFFQRVTSRPALVFVFFICSAWPKAKLCFALMWHCYNVWRDSGPMWHMNFHCVNSWRHRILQSDTYECRELQYWQIKWRERKNGPISKITFEYIVFIGFMDRNWIKYATDNSTLIIAFQLAIIDSWVLFFADHEMFSIFYDDGWQFAFV